MLNKVQQGVRAARSDDIYGDTNPLPRLIVQRTRDVNGAGHVFHGECTAYVPARDLVSNTRGCDRKEGCAFNKSKARLCNNAFVVIK